MTAQLSDRQPTPLSQVLSPTGAPPAPTRYQWADLVLQVSASGGCPELRAACTFHDVSIGTVARALAALVDAGHWNGQAWRGYIKHEVAALLALSERTARRVVKVLRAVLVLDADIPEPHQDESGNYSRGPSTFRLALPAWARAAHWRERPGGPSGQRWPQKRGPGPDPSLSSTSATRKTKAHTSDVDLDAGDNAPPAPPSADYVKERNALIARNGGGGRWPWRR